MSCIESSTTKLAGSPAQVFLIGAGPGDPGMLTLRGAEALRRCGAVLYDSLANPQILELAPPSAVQICVGKHGKSRIWSQDEINAKMISLAQQGTVVARLKGGDPAVFARAAEEIEALSLAGVPFEMVPGVTAAIAAGSSSGVPLTHRGVASAVAFITGQEVVGKEGDHLDFDALAKFPGTLVFYMGVTTASQWTAALLSAGKSPGTPAAILRRCSLPDQQSIYCTLGEVADILTPASRFRPPVVVMVGNVVNERTTPWWFEKRPLFGQRILVTRPEDQARALRDKLAELGADVLLQPAIEIGPPPNWRAVDEAIQRLPDFDWIVFSSKNGVDAFCGRVFEQGYDARRFGAMRIAAIGPGTQQALRHFGLHADLLPQEYRAESLAEKLATSASGTKFLLIRASRGREVLADTLRQAGALIEQVVVYQSTDVQSVRPEVAQALVEGGIDWITITSSAIAKSLANLLGDQLHSAKLASISPVTSGTLRSLGYAPACEASEYTMQGLVDALVEASAG